MDYIWAILSSSFLSAGVVFWLGKKWLSTRIEGSIQNEYAKELEKYKNNFNREIQKTELFFSHKEKAFSSIITTILEIKEEWISRGKINFDEYEPVGAPPHTEKKLLHTINHNFLFLEQDARIALNLLVMSLLNGISTAEVQGGGCQVESFDPLMRFEAVSYLVITLFQEKIGLPVKGTGISEDIACLESIEILNSIRSPKFKLPLCLRKEKNESILSSIARGKENKVLLIKTLKKSLISLKKENNFDYIEKRILPCLGILSNDANME